MRLVLAVRNRLDRRRRNRLRPLAHLPWWTAPEQPEWVDA